MPQNFCSFHFCLFQWTYIGGGEHLSVPSLLLYNPPSAPQTRLLEFFHQCLIPTCNCCLFACFFSRTGELSLTVVLACVMLFPVSIAIACSVARRASSRENSGCAGKLSKGSDTGQIGRWQEGPGACTPHLSLELLKKKGGGAVIQLGISGKDLAGTLPRSSFVVQLWGLSPAVN